MKNKKTIIIISSIIITIAIVLFLSTGKPRTDVYLKNFNLSSTGDRMTLNIGLSSSAGYIRKMKKTSGSMNYYLTFYSTFGINSKLGAKDTFEINLDENVDEIYFYTGDKGYKKVLEKKENGEWIRVLDTTNQEELGILEALVLTKKIVIEDRIKNETKKIINDETIIKEIVDIVSHASEINADATITPLQNYDLLMYDDNNNLITKILVWNDSAIGFTSRDYTIPTEDNIRLQEIIE